MTRSTILLLWQVLGKSLGGDVPRDATERVGDGVAEWLKAEDLDLAFQLNTPWLGDFGQVT